ncbi:MAG: nucleoside-diphosphate-sugar epimerase [Sulfitobacter sp.]|jgi:UDP-glucose 4-epimerase
MKSQTPNPMKILITGANGFIGSALMCALEKSHEVIGLVRRAQNLPFNYSVIDDICQITADDLVGVACVIHAAGIAETGADEAELQRVNVEGAKCLAIACRKAGVAQLINLSSVKAAGEGSVGPDVADQPDSAYGRSKHLAEVEIDSVTAGSDTQVVHLRFPLVYGPEVQNNFQKLIRLSKSWLPLPLSSLTAKRSYCFIGNLIELIESHLGSASAEAVIYVADAEPMTLPALLAELARVQGNRPMLIPFPESLLKLVVKLIKPGYSNQLFANAVVDISSTRDLFKDWKPKTTVDALSYLEIGRDGRI